MADKYFPLDELTKVLNRIAELLPERKDELHQIGYDVDDLERELARMINAEMRKNLVRQKLAVMPDNVKKAVHALSMALSLESTPSYRNGCYDALTDLLSLQCLDNDDLRRVAQLTEPQD
ncbi:hypothetical protein [Spirosoma sordidisoli]|uniref:Uncharacterized protein n=1 Tax=Spirosoma sordidisoli TaxID=2502893 RepID=A0A4Q2USX8_9BACT|nr:hypothetical protein [Spirosoma sordidisoli]RYC70840.1 hypothetical protein EQG79_01430 [Spirosoma sordidisoli]